MDWERYKELGVGAKFEEKPGRDSGGSGWHWYKSHKPGEGRDAPVPPQGSPEREALIAEHRAQRAGELEKYPLPPEAHRVEGVPIGTVTHHEGWACQEFAETTREYWVYVPQQYEPGTAAKLIVCQDGDGYLDPEGEIRVGVVLDNMIAAGELPPTVALFVRPGVPLPDAQRTQYGLCPKGDIAPRDWERSFEYDSITGKYGDMLINELIPQIEEQHGLTISGTEDGLLMRFFLVVKTEYLPRQARDKHRKSLPKRPFSAEDPMDRLIMGHSSGGVASSAAGFNHPEAFGCVVSHCASYVNIRGAHQLAWAVRNSERRPIKVLLLIGTNDNDNDHGNNPLGNEQLASALEYADYDSKLVMGTGWHNKVHGSHVFPDTLRWMFGSAPPPNEFASFLGAGAKL
jgi:enterochelin esterase-like enzyme